jgi:chaperonin GroES
MKKTNVKPLGENVLLLPERPEERTSAGIYLPDTAREERPQQGKVLAIGDSDKIKVKVGDRVIFNRYGGTEIKVDLTDCLLVTNKDVLAVVDAK